LSRANSSTQAKLFSIDILPISAIKLKMVAAANLVELAALVIMFRAAAITSSAVLLGLLASTTIAVSAPAKCTSVSAQCAVEIGGRCDPATGRWQYGRIGSGGTNRFGAFDACIARKLRERKR